MTQFNTNVYGYNKDEVDKYFADLESQYIRILSQKKTEYNLVKDKINQIDSENKKIASEIDIENKKKSDYLNNMNQELSKIESSLEVKQQEADATKRAAVETLLNKRQELEKCYQSLTQIKKDLSSIKNRTRLVENYYNQS